MSRRFLSVEGLDNNETDLVEVSREEQPYAELAENDMIAAGETAEEFDQIRQETETVAEVAADLDAHADVVEATLPEGGLSEAGANVARVAAESLYARIGLRQIAGRKLAKESFGKEASPEASIEATRLSVEGWRDDARKMVTAVINAIRAMLERAQTFFTQIFDGAERMRKRAKSVSTRAQAMGDKLPDHIKGHSFLVNNGKVLSGSDLISAYAEIAKVDAYGKDQIRALGSAFGELAEVPNEQDKARTVFEKIVGLQVPGGQEGMEEKEGRLQKNIALPIGDRVLTIDMAGDSAKDSEILTRLTGLGSSKAYLGENKKAAKASVDNVVPLNKQQIIDLCKTIDSEMKAYAEMKTIVEEMRKASKASLDKLEAISKQSPKEEKENAGKAFKAAAGAVRGTVSCVLSGSMAMKRYHVSATKAVLDFADSSIKASQGKSSTEVATA
jgi:phiKZ-like phage internal head proteins